ncbi:presenilin-like protein At2g29900 [Elaeis guineensis]|uniref:presenilin-like protein At2g29900 n=1 Tax=Elaeis guineensis var. tenera TaxID=51953 RepID=UPI003C6D405D
MAQDPDSTPSLLDSLGEEIIRIVAPVSACMLLVVLLVSTLSSSSSSPSPLSSLIATAYSDPSSSSSIWDKLSGALLSSLVFVASVTLITFLLVLLFYFRCTRFLKSYMAFSSFVVLAFLGGEVILLLVTHFDFPIDAITFSLLLLNFSVVGVMSVFMAKMPISINQGYLVIIGVLVAYWFTLLPEWTTWALLVTMALYDLAAVLLPGGPLRLLVELAISRDEEIPALVYEARPVEPLPGARRRLWRERRDFGTNSGSNSNPSSLGYMFRQTDERRDFGTNSSLNSNNSMTGEVLPETRLVISEQESAGDSSVSELRAPLLQTQLDSHGEQEIEGIGLGSSGAIKLGLGDFIFYSVLVGRAALYDFMTVYACYLAIIAGLGITLLLLAFYRKALPALPVSIMLGVLFYLLTRVLLEVFVVQCSTNLLMF